jgi:hypothetical protein
MKKVKKIGLTWTPESLKKNATASYPEEPNPKWGLELTRRETKAGVNPLNQGN